MTDETATARLAIKPSTKELIDERKPDGKTYDLWVRQCALGLDE